MTESLALLVLLLLCLELDQGLLLVLLLHVPSGPAALLSRLVDALLPLAYEGREDELLGLLTAELAFLRLDPIRHRNGKLARAI